MPATVDLTNPIFTDPDKARSHFEAIRWPQGAYCPFCGQTDTVKRLVASRWGRVGITVKIAAASSRPQLVRFTSVRTFR